MNLKINKLIKNNKKQIGFFVFLICLITLYFFIDPSKSGYFLRCPLKILTGYECAGCGVQRAFHSLLHFRLLEAFKFNPLFAFSIPFLIGALLVYFSKNQKIKQDFRHFFMNRIAVFVVLIIVFVFSLIRNTDFYTDFITRL